MEAQTEAVAPTPTPFIKLLARQMRAQDPTGAWDQKSDEEVLRPYVLDREARRKLPVSGDPDPDVLWRLEIFYSAVGLAIEARTGVPCAPIMQMHHEGFGRMVLVSGRLVVLNKFLRDVHRFGFDRFETLDTRGQALIDEGVALVTAEMRMARWGT